MTAIYPSINSAPISLRAASVTGVITEPQVTTIPAAGYTEVVGIAGVPLNVQIKLLDDADSDDGVLVEICDEPTFTVPTEHSASPVVFSDKPTGEIVQFGIEGAPGYFRINNTSDTPIEVNIWRLPNRR